MEGFVFFFFSTMVYLLWFSSMFVPFQMLVLEVVYCKTLMNIHVSALGQQPKTLGYVYILSQIYKFWHPFNFNINV